MVGALLVMAQLAITVAAPDTVPVDSVAEVVVRVTSEGLNTATLTPMRFPHFTLLRSASSQRTEIDAGGVVRSL